MISKSVAFFIAGMFMATSAAISASPYKIQGVLLEKGTRKPLSGVNVFILPHKLKGTTDDQGKFTIENVPAGKIQWIVNSAGYERLTLDEELDDETAADEWRLYLEKVSYMAYETTVTGRQKKRDDSTKSMKQEVFTQLPGSGGDPIKAVQNLPGVNRAGGFSSQVIIQGSAPQDTRYMIDGHEVPIIFHFGGLSSVVFPQAIDRVDYLSAGYGPEYSRAMGGLGGVWSKQPRKDRWGGLGYVDLMNSGAMVEGPVGEKGSVMAGVRRSYIGQVLKQAAKRVGGDSFNLTVAPTFSDAILAYDGDVTERDHIRLLGVGSQDTMQFVLAKPIDQAPSVRGTFDLRTAFYRFIPQVTHKHSEKSTSRWSLGVGRDWNRIDIGQGYFYVTTDAVTSRGEVERKFSEHYTSQVGFDNRYTHGKVDLSLPGMPSGRGGVSNPLSAGTYRTAHIDRTTNVFGGYWRNEIKPWAEGGWSILPNARVEYFGMTKEVLPAPRLALKYQWDDSLFFKAASGMYYQPPTEQQTDKTYGNPNIKAPFAIHYMGGAEKDFRGGSSRGFIVSGEGFYRQFDKLVVSSSKTVTRDGSTVSENYNNDGNGRAYGAQTQIRLEAAPWNGWVSYTLSKSTRWNEGKAEEIFQYDQTHLLTVLGGVDVGRNWRLASRFRYVTGNPSTPITGAIFDSDSDSYSPIRGAIYSTRMQPFMQFDIRIDKKWVYNRWILSVYLDIQNVTNRKNPEAVRYSYDYSQMAVVSGLPVFPTLGLKGEF